MTRNRRGSWLRMLALRHWNRRGSGVRVKGGETVKPDRQQPNGMARTSWLPLLVARDLVENLHPLRADVTRKGKIKL